MVPDTTSSATADQPPEDDQLSVAVNGLIGAVAGVVLGFVPLSTLLGGALAGYLEGGAPRDGLVAGGIAGLVMLGPFALGLFGLLYLLGFGGAPSAFGLAGIVVLFCSALYAVGLGLLGGLLGAALADEF